MVNTKTWYMVYVSCFLFTSSPVNGRTSAYWISFKIESEINRAWAVPDVWIEKHVGEVNDAFLPIFNI